MKPRFALFVFFVLMSASVGAGIDSLAAAAAVWLALSLWWIGRQRRRVAGAVCMGRLQYSPEVGRFFADGHEVRLTPMQRTLMEMFLVAEEHSLSQREICDRLWPRKPDASATLYTLMRRLRPVIEEKAGLHIECLRGEAYRLKES